MGEARGRAALLALLVVPLAGLVDVGSAAHTREVPQGEGGVAVRFAVNGTTVLADARRDAYASLVTWDFGDGTPTVQGSSAVHHYAAPGKYVVNATVATGGRTRASSATLQLEGQVALVEVGSLPQSRTGAVAVAHDGKVLVFGGGRRDVAALTPEGLASAPSAPLTFPEPLDRVGVALDAARGVAFVVDGARGVVHRATLATGKVDPFATLPARTPDAKVALVGSKLLVFGAHADGAVRQFDIDASRSFDPGGPQRFEGAGFAWDGQQAYLVGGLDASGFPVARIARYRPALDTYTAWEDLGQLPIARTNATVLALGGDLLVVGGCFDAACQRPAADVLRFNVTTRTTSQLDPGLGAWRADAAAVWTGAHVLLVGGTGAPGALGSVARYRLSDATVTPLASPVASLPLFPADARRLAPATATDGRTLWLLGGGKSGQGAPTATRDVVAYTPAMRTASVHPGLLPEAVQGAAALLVDGKVYVFGGDTASGRGAWRFDPSASGAAAGHTLRALPSAVPSPILAKDGAAILILGAPDGKSYRYDPASDTYAEAALPPVPAGARGVDLGGSVAWWTPDDADRGVVGRTGRLWIAGGTSTGLDVAFRAPGARAVAAEGLVLLVGAGSPFDAATGRILWWDAAGTGNATRAGVVDGRLPAAREEPALFYDRASRELHVVGGSVRGDARHEVFVLPVDPARPGPERTPTLSPDVRVSGGSVEVHEGGGAIDVAWAFGDGTALEPFPEATHTYAVGRAYTASLRAMTNEGIGRTREFPVQAAPKVEQRSFTVGVRTCTVSIVFFNPNVDAVSVAVTLLTENATRGANATRAFTLGPGERTVALSVGPPPGVVTRVALSVDGGPRTAWQECIVPIGVSLEAFDIVHGTPNFWNLTLHNPNAEPQRVALALHVGLAMEELVLLVPPGRTSFLHPLDAVPGTRVEIAAGVKGGAAPTSRSVSLDLAVSLAAASVESLRPPLLRAEIRNPNQFPVATTVTVAAGSRVENHTVEAAPGPSFVDLPIPLLPGVRGEVEVRLLEARFALDVTLPSEPLTLRGFNVTPGDPPRILVELHNPNGVTLPANLTFHEDEGRTRVPYEVPPGTVKVEREVLTTPCFPVRLTVSLEPAPPLASQTATVPCRAVTLADLSLQPSTDASRPRVFANVSVSNLNPVPVTVNVTFEVGKQEEKVSYLAPPGVSVLHHAIDLLRGGETEVAVLLDAPSGSARSAGTLDVPVPPGDPVVALMAGSAVGILGGVATGLVLRRLRRPAEKK